MVVSKPMKKCPFCLEPIAVAASRCKHCQADLTGDKKTKSGSAFASINNFRVGFISGVLFALILAILAYGHFNWGG